MILTSSSWHRHHSLWRVCVDGDNDTAVQVRVSVLAAAGVFLHCFVVVSGLEGFVDAAGGGK